MGKDDDIVLYSYPYRWTPTSEITLQEFLAKYKPSMVQNDGTRPWLWVNKDSQQTASGDVDAAVKEATAYLSEVTERVEKIQNDDSIPVRSNKKKGLKSKKELREEVQGEATQRLKDIATKHGYVCGKWLIFATPDKVDMIWSTIANSLTSGPLSSTGAFLTKVATSPQMETPNYSHLICVYMPNAYDQTSVTEVMKVLLRKHGMTLMGVKSDLYTAINLDSKHPSGVSSTIWKNTALMKDTEMKKLKEEYFAELNSIRAEEAAAKKAASGTVGKAKPQLKKKTGADDPFASDDDEEDEKKGKKAAKVPAPSASKGKKPELKKKPAANDFASDDDEEGEEARKAELKAKKSTAVKKRKGDSSDDESDHAPKKKKGRA